VLKSESAHAKGMKTTENITRTGRIRASLRHLWPETHHASRTQSQLSPYDEYLQHGRYTH